MGHEVVEKNIGLMAVLVLLVISVGGLVEIVPLFFLKSTTEPVEGLKPYTALLKNLRTDMMLPTRPTNIPPTTMAAHALGGTKRSQSAVGSSSNDVNASRNKYWCAT